VQLRRAYEFEGDMEGYKTNSQRYISSGQSCSSHGGALAELRLEELISVKSIQI